MQILAHRGFWKTEEERNSLIAIKRAFDNGYGIETDIRDRNGQIVISHNPPNDDSPLLTDVLDLWKNCSSKPILALNIKSDGLYLLLENIFEEYKLSHEDYFLFDSSIPEQYVYIKRGYNIYTRSSEFEQEIAFWNDSKGVWLDQFTDCSHISDNLEQLISTGKCISVVSPELHKRNKDSIWIELKQYSSKENLILCTDVPDVAKEYFNE